MFYSYSEWVTQRREQIKLVRRLAARFRVPPGTVMARLKWIPVELDVLTRKPNEPFDAWVQKIGDLLQDYFEKGEPNERRR